MSLITFSGLATGIDSKGLIDALISQQRNGRIKPLQAKISSTKETNEALSSLKGLLSSLSSAVDNLRTLSGGVIKKAATSSDSSAVGVSSSTSATNGTYAITVNQLAKNGTASLSSSSGNFTSLDQAFATVNDGAAAADRTLTISIGDGANQVDYDFEITSTTTLAQLTTQINDQIQGAVATAVNVGTEGSPNYKLVITSTNEGVSEGSVQVSSGAELTANGYLDDNLISQATDAEFSISGIGSGSGGSETITRSSNTITDVLPGITLTLSKTSVDPITITVKDDAAASSSAMNEVVEAYNKLVQFITENDKITTEQTGGEVQSIFGPLANTSLDESVLSTIKAALTGSSTSGGSINTLADLGITTQKDGTLKFDSAIFNSALNTDPESLLAITQKLGDTLGGTEGTISQFTKFGGLLDVATNSNNNQITSLNDKVSAIEKSLAQQEESLTKQFARLEALVSQLQSSQNALSQLLAF